MDSPAEFALVAVETADSPDTLAGRIAGDKGQDSCCSGAPVLVSAAIEVLGIAAGAAAGARSQCIESPGLNRWLQSAQQHPFAQLQARSPAHE